MDYCTNVTKKYLESGIDNGELIIGIVSSVGTDTKQVIETLKGRLEGFKYNVEEIKVSSLMSKPEVEITSEYERIKYYMENGDSLRKNSNNNAILAAGVAQKINEKRRNSTQNYDKRAFIVNSLKHPKEVEFLRKIYGVGFFLIGIHADKERRKDYLLKDKHIDIDSANELIRIDEDESLDYGQKTRDTYHLADFFLNFGNNTDYIKNHLQRFLELIFSHPFRNPTFDEFAMFMAFNSSVRSGDLSRQVGAVIGKEKQILATGANDVPTAGGGLYWAEQNENGEIDDTPDGKDYKRGKDTNKAVQKEIIEEIQKIISEKINEPLDLSQILKETKISDLTEFGRIVHAEMDALLACSRMGIPTIGATLYCTTFPCHNCAKHIIASGIKRVVYVEPYPKSRALEFHSESIILRSDFENPIEENKISFEPFIGVGPRRFLDLFSISLGVGAKLKRKNKDGSILKWEQNHANMRTPLIPKSYIEIEEAAIDIWKNRKNSNLS
ncbi:cytidine deaminase [Neisseria dumasiana]|nr:cytidine deaminase [Neisseria dumasiana]